MLFGGGYACSPTLFPAFAMYLSTLNQARKNPEHSCGESQSVPFSVVVLCHLIGCHVQADGLHHSGEQAAVLSKAAVPT